MYKSVLILFNVIATLMLNVIFGDGVKVTQNSPSEIKPGEEFTVEMIINKTDVSGFAKIQQELPAGFTAEAIETQGASFTFNEQKVKLIWMSLPEAEDFTIKYKVSVDKNVTGDFEITGKFSYLHNNERKTVALNGNFISVKEPEELVENSLEPTSTMEEPDEITVSTTRTITQNNDGSYNIQLNIKHNGLKGFSKIQETLPIGIELAEGINTANAVFSNVDGLAKFVWMSVPKEEEIIVSYSLTGNVTQDDFNNMSGTFAYLDKEESKKQSISTTSIQLSETTEEEILVENTDPSVNTNTEDTSSTQNIENIEPLVEEVIAENIENEEQLAQAEEEAKKKEEQEALTKQRDEEEKRELEEARLAAKQAELNAALEEENNTTASAIEEPTMTSTPSPQTGINYKVQICAGHEAIKVENHFQKEYSFTEEAIATENHEGWIKYTIGGFDTYKTARNRRNVVTDGYTFPGPFVTAYNSGNRITVQEALMISNQNWVQ